jgi:flagellar hook-associated protein 2
VSTSDVSGSNSTGLITPITIDSSTGSSGSTLTNTGAGGTTQIVGLASGINTTELIQAELAQQEAPLLNLEDEVTAMNTEDTTLSSIQDQLQTVSQDALVLGEPSTYFPVQTITSSNSSLITAATTSGVGAPIGSSTVTVTNLATAAQTTYDWTPPSGSDTLTFNVGSGSTSPTLTVAAGTTATQVADQVNGDSSLGVYATVETGAGGQQQLIFSSAQTGADNTVNVSDTAGSLGGANGNAYVAQQDGTDATYYVNGVEGQSASDTVTGAIPGTTLTLLGVTGSTSTDNPITITAQAPGPNVSAIVQEVQQFVTDYNTALNAMNTDTNTAPTSEDTPSDYSPYSGSLFGDSELEGLQASMRDSMYQNYSGAGITSGYTSLTQIGISTGAATGTIQSSQVTGDLSVNTTQLTQALETDPSAVQSLLQKWSTGFQSVVNNAASPAGALSTRISGNNTLISQFSQTISSQEAMYTQEESQMEEQWAQVESTLEDLDNQKTDLSSFSAGLTSSSSSS